MNKEVEAARSTSGAGEFTTTHWTVVLQAEKGESSQAVAALEQLCRTYWYPLYVFVRRRGHSPEEAQDLTQEFFAQFLQKDYFQLADPGRGRFRTFLLHALEHFLINEWRRGQRIKRGGGIVPFSLDATEAEARYLEEAVTKLTPEHCYERRWAVALLESVLAALRKEYTESGQAQVFQELADLLWGRDVSVSYAQAAQRLGMTEGAVRSAMHRLRQRFRERLRMEVAQTVAEPGEVEQELRYLLEVVSQR